MKNEPDITIIIATFNRAAILNDTLQSMSEVNADGINVEFAIVDNNSTDNTKEVILNWAKKLNVRYLHEKRPGQNPARNRALAEIEPGKIIVFTDDDVVPNTNWFKVILQTSEQWPEYSVFGGRIYPIWPSDIDFPKWAQEEAVQSFGFAVHNYKDKQCVYEKQDYPFSPNFWVRRKIFSNKKMFDNKIEWHPKNQIMATETMFFKELVEDGYRIVYCPEAVVGHKIRPEQLTVKSILKRSYSCGRGTAYLRSFCRSDLLQKNPLLWYTMRYGAIAKLGMKLGMGILPAVFEKPQTAMYAMEWLGYNIELLRLAEENKSNIKEDTNICIK
jgi:glycosyltransferase involved in cell wall biosynthesis